MSTPILLFLSLLLTAPSPSNAALQARPVSTFPTDPYASPKFDVAFLNHLPISRSEADYWVGGGGNLKDDGNGGARESEGVRGKSTGRRKARTQEDRESVLRIMRQLALEDAASLSAEVTSSPPGISEDQSANPPPTLPPSSLLTPPPQNPLELSFLTDTPPLSALSHVLSLPPPITASDELVLVEDNIEAAYETLVYWWTRRSEEASLSLSASSEAAHDPSSLDPFQALHSLSRSSPADAAHTSSSSPSGGPIDDQPPSFLLPTFKILKLPSPNLTPSPSSKSSTSASSTQAQPVTDYLCMTPSLYSQNLASSLLKANQTAQALAALQDAQQAGAEAGSQEDEEGKEVDPWGSLKHLEGQCLYHRQGWFTYSYCHGSHVRQFRAAGQQAGPGGFIPLEDMNFEAYNLGLSIAAADHRLEIAQHRADTTGQEQHINDMDSPPPLPLNLLSVTAEVVDAEAEAAHGGPVGIYAYPGGKRAAQEQKRELAFKRKQAQAMGMGGKRDARGNPKERHLSLTWGAGTLCDITGRERKIEVQFHCRMDGVDEIAFVKEVATCQYVLIIHTPRLCTLPGFHTPSPADHPSHSIKCRQIVPDDKIIRSLQTREQAMRRTQERYLLERGASRGRASEGGLPGLQEILDERLEKIKQVGSRAPEGAAGPEHLYEWVDGGLPAKKLATGQGNKDLEPVTITVETEDGTYQEIIVDVVIEDDSEDLRDEYGREIAKLPKAKKRKMVKAEDGVKEMSEDERRAYVQAKREENIRKRDAMAAAERAEKLMREQEKGLGAKMGKWWDGMMKKSAGGSSDEDEEGGGIKKEL